MKTNKYMLFSVNIIVLFLIAILSSFIPEYYANFFGDYGCSGSTFEILEGHYIRHGCDIFDMHEPTTHWGYRHYLWFLMGLSLFAGQVVRIINLLST
jgi:hypothetical protein